MASSVTINVPFGPFKGARGRVRLLLEGLERAPESFAIRVFLEQTGADARTPVEGNPHYAGTVYLYGHGQTSPGQEMFPERAARQRKPYDQSLDVTKVMEDIEPPGDNAAVTLVPVDLHDNPLNADFVRFRRMALVAED